MLSEIKKQLDALIETPFKKAMLRVQDCTYVDPETGKDMIDLAKLAGPRYIK